MRKQRLSQDYLADILDAIAKAESFVAGMKFSDFSSDEKTVYAVIRTLEIIGEATKKIPTSIRDRNHDIPWRQLAGMRDMGVRGQVSVCLIWRIFGRFVFMSRPLRIEPLRRRKGKPAQRLNGTLIYAERAGFSD